MKVLTGRRQSARILAVSGVTGFVLAVTASCCWYLVTPRMTMTAMTEAIARRDGAALASYMDMDALRLSTRIGAEGVIRRAYPGGRVHLDPHGITEALIGKTIDRIFSPKGTQEMLRRQRKPLGTKEVNYTIIRMGPNAFIARLDEPTRVDLMFTRHIVSWRLSSIIQRPKIRAGAIA